MSNKTTIANIYQAFGENNVPFILDHIADDVVWDYGSTSIDVPWLKRREGRQGAAEFFQAVGSNLQMEKFEPKAILEDGDVVISRLDIEFTVRSTGRRIVETDAVHVFRFDSNGKISGFRHGVDTYEHFRAFSASADASGASA